MNDFCLFLNRFPALYIETMELGITSEPNLL